MKEIRKPDGKMEDKEILTNGVERRKRKRKHTLLLLGMNNNNKKQDK